MKSGKATDKIRNIPRTCSHLLAKVQGQSGFDETSVRFSSEAVLANSGKDIVWNAANLFLVMLVAVMAYRALLSYPHPSPLFYSSTGSTGIRVPILCQFYSAFLCSHLGAPVIQSPLSLYIHLAKRWGLVVLYWTKIG